MGTQRTGNITIAEARQRFKKVYLGIIRNKNIDCLTLGIYVKILTLGADWELNIKGLSTIFNISDAKVRKAIALLEKEGFVARHAIKDDRGKFEGYNYTFYAEPLEENERTKAGVAKTDYPGNGVPRKRTTPETGYPETTIPNIYRLNETIDNNLSIESNNTPSKEFDADTRNNKKTLFRNSATAQLVECIKGPSNDAGVAPVTFNYSKFIELFPGEEFKQIDLVYYYNVVADWSDQKDVKRTNRGWIATIRNFIRGDMEKNKLHVLPQYNTTTDGFNLEDAAEFLKL